MPHGTLADGSGERYSMACMWSAAATRMCRVCDKPRGNLLRYHHGYHSSGHTSVERASPAPPARPLRPLPASRRPRDLIVTYEHTTHAKSTPPTAHAAPSPVAAVHPTAVSSSRYEKNRASAPQRAPLVLNGYSRLVQRNDNGDGIAGERRPVPHHFGRVGSQQRSLLTLTHSSPAIP